MIKWKDAKFGKVATIAASGLLSRGINFAVIIAVVPLTLPHFGQEKFGVLMTLLSLGSLFSFLDFGIGSAMIREVARHHGPQGCEARDQVIKSGLILITFTSIAAFAVFYVTATMIPVSVIFSGLSEANESEATDAIKWFVVIFSLVFPMQGLSKIYQGMQCIHRTYILSSIFSATSIIILYFIPKENLTIQLTIVLIYGLPGLAPLFFFGSFVREHLQFKPLDFSSFMLEAKRLLTAGSLFFILQLGYVAGWSLDTSLTSSMLGVSSVAALAIVQRMYQLVTVPLAVVNAPLWAFYSSAVARNDVALVYRTLRLSLMGTLAAAVLGAGAILLLHKPLTAIWLGDTVYLPLALLAAAAVMAVLEACGNAFAMYLNGLHIVKPQLLVVGIFVCLSIPIKLFLMGQFGVVGLVAGTALCYVACVVLPYVTFLRRHVVVPMTV
jgi:O-antigen/teichoic acid export membrane protein